jgi:cyclic pyranopterin monophosphate synthase
MNGYSMIDVSSKNATHRRAIAQGVITVGESAFEHIKNKTLPKGDALLLAEIAGISGAKKASDLLPLCHPLGLDHIDIQTTLLEDRHAILVYCTVSSYAKTGVEMEALAGVSAALLAIYDVTKMVEPALLMSDIRLLLKEGGKRGRWLHPLGAPDEIAQEKQKKLGLSGVSAALVVLSDRANKGDYEDKSGPMLKTCLQACGASIVDLTVLPDEKEQLITHLRALVEIQKPQLIITSGGTGIGPRDITPDVFDAVCDRIVPGFGELLRHDSARYYTKFAWLSRCLAGIIGQTLIVALPGSPKAVKESLLILEDLLPHALKMASGGGHD